MRVYYWLKHLKDLGCSCSWEVAGCIVSAHRTANQGWGFWNAYWSHLTAPWNRNNNEEQGL